MTEDKTRPAEAVRVSAQITVVTVASCISVSAILLTISLAMALFG